MKKKKNKIVWTTRVYAKNFVTDFFQNLKNIIGGRLKGYENLINEAMTDTTEQFAKEHPDAEPLKIDLHEFGNQSIAITIYGIIR